MFKTLPIIISLLQLASPALADDSAAFSQCAVNLCGAPKSFTDRLTPDQLAEIATPQTRKWLAQNVDPQLETLIADAWKIETVRENSVPKLLAQLDSPYALPEERALILTGLIHSIFSSAKYTNFLIPSPQDGWMVDENPFNQAFSQLSEGGRKTLIAAANAVYGSTFFSLEADLAPEMSLPSFLYIMGIFLEKDATTVTVQDVATHSMSVVSSVSAKLGSSVFDSAFVKIVENVARSGQIKPGQTSSFIRAVGTIEHTGNAIQTIVAANIDSSQLKANDIVTLLGMSQSKSQVAAMTVQQRATITAQRKKEFRHAITTLLATAPSPAENEQALRRIDSIKQSAESVIADKNLGTPALQLSAQKAVQNVSFILPVDQLTLEPEILAQLNQTVSNYEDILHTSSSLAQGGPGWTVFLASALRNMNFDTIETLGFMHDQMSYFSLADLNDSDGAITGITTSWETVKFPQYGTWIMAHELGHAVSRVLKDNLSGVKQCTANKHELLNSFDRTKPLANAEEDWADAFAFAVAVKRGGVKSGLQNAGCLMLKTSPDHKAYGALSLSYVPGDSHSNDFYRLLQEQSAIGPLPAACADLIPAAVRAPFFKSCL